MPSGFPQEKPLAAPLWFSPLPGQARPEGSPRAIASMRFSRYTNEMKIHELIWTEDRVNHIARHGVTPEEAEEACFGRALVQRGTTEGRNPVY